MQAHMYNERKQTNIFICIKRYLERFIETFNNGYFKGEVSLRLGEAGESLLLTLYLLHYMDYFTTSMHHFYRRIKFRIVVISRDSLVAQTVKSLPTMQETWVQSLGWEDPLEKEMATHSSILAWRIPWTEEPSRLQPMGLQS